MSNTTEPNTFNELAIDLRDRMGWGVEHTVRAQRLVNTALVNVHRNPMHKMPWPERRGVVITHEPYSTGTVSITVASSRTAVSGSGTAWNTAVPGYGFNNVRVGGKIKFAGTHDYYTVATITSDTALTLATNYVGDDLSAVSYTYFEDEYALAADFEDIVDMQMFSSDMNIPLIGRTDFRRAVPRNDLTQQPKVATLIQIDFASSAAAQYRVVFNPVPDRVYQIPYWYKSNYLAVSWDGVRKSRLVDATDEPVMPVGKRQAITLYAKYEAYNDYGDDAQRAATAFSEYATFLQRIAGEMKSSDAKPQFYVQRRAGLPREQRFDVGDRFSTLRDRWR